MGIIQKMDFLILNWLQKHLRGKTLDILMPMITALGNGGFLFALLTIGLLCTRRWRREGVAVGFSLLLCLLAGNLFLKPLVGRIRPYDLVDGFQLLIKPLPDYSFPSDGSLCLCRGLLALSADVRRLVECDDGFSGADGIFPLVPVCAFSDRRFVRSAVRIAGKLDGSSSDRIAVCPKIKIKNDKIR